MKSTYDVIVAGGGLTGVAAAIAAKRNGVKDVLLIERYGFLGGMATSGLVHPFMTYFKSKKPYKEEYQLIFGIFQEILDHLNKLGALKDKSYFDDESMKLILNRMVLEAGVDILFHTYVQGVQVEAAEIKNIGVVNKSGIQQFEGKVFIDCTGDGDVAYMSGVHFKKGRDEDGFCQPMTMCFRVANVDQKKMPNRKVINDLYLKAVARGDINNTRENVLFFKTLQDDVFHFNTTRIIMKDATDAQELTQAELEVREQVWQMFYFLKNEIPGFENSYLQLTAPQIGIRETRRIIGKYILTGKDIEEAKKFEDGICNFAYCVDIHNPTGIGTKIIDLPEGEYYNIPYRCLINDTINNLLVAGRPISSDHEAHSSLRVMPACTQLGQVAGTAAALSIKENVTVNQLDAKKLRALLIKQGAL